MLSRKIKTIRAGEGSNNERETYIMRRGRNWTFTDCFLI